MCDCIPDEIEVDCWFCDGAGCHLCERSGRQFIPAEAVTLDDLEERDEEEARAAARARKDAIMARVDATIEMIRDLCVLGLFLGVVALWSGIGTGSI